MPLAKRHEVQVRALSAYAGEIDQQQALAAGFKRHIAQPVASLSKITQLVG